MLNRAVKYPDGWLPGIPGVRPLGIAKNATTIEAEDGAPWDKDYINDIDAVFQGAVFRRNITISDVPDTAAISDVLDAFGLMFGITHATLNSAIADTTLKVGMQVSTQDYHSIVRGGGGNYLVMLKVDSDALGITDYTHANRVSVVSGLALILREPIIINPKQWGIIDDGSEQTAAASALFAAAAGRKILWNVSAEINRADFGLRLDIEFSLNAEMTTSEITLKDGNGVITFAGASLISTTALSINIYKAKHSGDTPENSSYLIYVDSGNLESANIDRSDYVDSGHWIKGGQNTSIYETRNKFRSSDYSGVLSRVSAIAFAMASVGTEDFAAQNEPRDRFGRLFSNNNDFDVWCPSGSNIDLAKYTGLCQAPQIVNNLYHNRNINSEAEVDCFTASYRGKIDNDHRNCSLKVQTILGALSASTTSAPVAHFSRISASMKFDDQSVNTFGILARGGYFLVDQYVIDAKKTTANVDFNALHIRSSDGSYFEDEGTSGAAVNYRVGSGLIDIRCNNYNSKIISPFNEFTSKLHYDIDGVTVLGGNSLVANGLNPGSLRNVSIYHADNYPVFAIQGLNLYSQGNLLLKSDGSAPNAILQSEQGKNNFADTVASSVDPATLTATTLDINEGSADIDLEGTGNITDIIGGFRGSRITLRFVTGATTLVHNIAKISLKGGSNKILNAAGHVIELKRLSSNGVWYELGGTV